MADRGTTKCARCGAAGTGDGFYWMAHANFCRPCIRKFEAQGWARPKPGHSTSYELTESGGRAMPEFETVAYCKNDGMPVYRRWVEAGRARGVPDPVCIHCLRRAGG